MSTAVCKIKTVRLLLLILGVSLLTAGIFTGNTEKPYVPETSTFASEPVKIDPQFLVSVTPAAVAKNPPVRLLIPDLGIDLEVGEARVVNGYWEVFNDKAGFGMGSAYPEESGNQVIFAHARQGLFLPLKNAKNGQLVYVFTKDKWFQYQIEEILEVLPSQTEVIAQTPETILTLYTCTGFADSKRLIVKAKRVKDTPDFSGNRP